MQRNRMLLIATVAVACARPGGPPPPGPQTAGDSSDVRPTETSVADRTAVVNPNDPSIQPRVAYLAGLMPVGNIGVDQFLARDPTADGRGVIIGILDSGLDPGLPGFALTTTGERKILDLRDFSGEGKVDLTQVVPADPTTIVIGGKTLTGFEVVAGVASPPYYAGILREIPLGGPDVNGNANVRDEFPLLVGRTSAGWAVFADTNENGLLSDERPVYDYLVGADLLRIGKGLMTMAVNLHEDGGRPVLNLFFDNDSHGSHVAGIAAGHNMFGESGFNGVAPGAYLLGLKISNNLRGGITTTGSMLRSMNYAADFAQQRGLPLVLNLSFGVANEREGSAAIDSLVNEFTLKHPDVVFVISAGNDGPGVSSVGFPGSADNIVSVCALFPGVFSGPRPRGFATDADGIAEFSSRGGELAKPDLCAPGVAYSNVPRWNMGGEVSGGTSMAAPQISGSAALLQSAASRRGRIGRAIEVKQSLIASASRVQGGTALDQGAGVPNLVLANEWLMSGHQTGMYHVRALNDGGNGSSLAAAFRRDGLANAADTIQRFEVRSIGGQPSARFVLRSDEPWLSVAGTVEMSGGPITIPVHYRAQRLRSPGMYVGSVWAYPQSDTLAGPAFRLTNTVIVPVQLTQPFVEGRDLGPGRLRRYFFDVQESSGGFAVEIELRYPTQQGTLYLFEPSGLPYRGGSSLQVGQGKVKQRLVVPSEDVISGVYEIVVSAPATTALTYELRVGLPRYPIQEIGSGPSVVVGMRENPPEFIQDASVFQREGELPTIADSVQIVARVLGASRTVQLQGRGAAPETLRFRAPDWAHEVEVTVALPDGAWNQYTDMGVTIFDTLGLKVAEGPMSHGYGRFVTKLEAYHRNHDLVLEIFPAFAHLEAPPTWTAEVTVALLAAKPDTLTMSNTDTSTVLTFDPGQFQLLRFDAATQARVAPEGYHPLIEVETNPAGGAPARLRRVLR